MKESLKTPIGEMLKSVNVTSMTSMSDKERVEKIKKDMMLNPLNIKMNDLTWLVGLAEKLLG